MPPPPNTISAQWGNHWATLTPDAIAVTYRGNAVTYEELRSRVHGWVAAVQRLTTDAPGVVALCAPRGVEQLAAYLGIMQAGAIALVLSADEPPTRRAALLARVRPQAAIVDDALLEHGSWPLEAIAMSDAQPADDVRWVPIDPHQPAQLVFTSGSTGQPKGMVGAHAAIALNTLRNTNDLDPHQGDRFGHLFPISWVASWMATFLPLAIGARMCLRDPGSESLARFVDWVSAEQISVMSLSPPLLQSMMSIATVNDPRLASIRLIKLTSARVEPSDIRRACQVLPDHCRFMVSYGTTETGSISRAFYTASSLPKQGRLPLGEPRPDVEVRIVDEHGAPVIGGAVGDIEVRRRESHRWPLDPEETLTAASRKTEVQQTEFISIGDRGRWTNDGEIDLHGRSNARVKVDSQAVDLTEVERALLRLDGVDASVAIAVRIGGRDRLVAFLVGPTSPTEREELVRSAPATLSKWLPISAVPTDFHIIDEIPLTDRSKLDSETLVKLATRGSRRPGHRTGTTTDPKK